MAELIDYKNVEIRQADQIVLHNVTLTVQSGEMIYLLGKVGSGKSSFMKTLYGALPIVSGEARSFKNRLRFAIRVFIRVYQSEIYNILR